MAMTLDLQLRVSSSGVGVGVAAGVVVGVTLGGRGVGRYGNGWNEGLACAST